MGDVRGLFDRLTGQAEALWDCLQDRRANPQTYAAEISGERSKNYSELVCYFASILGQLILVERVGGYSRNPRTSSSDFRRFVAVFDGASRWGEEKAQALIAARRRVAVLGETEISNSEDAFDIACELRSLASFAVVVREPQFLKQLAGVGSRFRRQVQELEVLERTRTARSIQRLLKHYVLYRSDADKNPDLFNEIYHCLFDVSALNQNFGDSMKYGDLEDILHSGGVSAETRSIVRHVIDAIQSMAEEGRDIYDIVAPLRGRAREPLRDVASSDDVVLIPGDSGGRCAPVLLAATHSARKGGNSPKSVMTSAQQVMIKCRGVLKVAIFLADPATHGREVEDHLPIIEDFINSGHFDVFLPVTVVGRRVNVLRWR